MKNYIILGMAALVIIVGTPSLSAAPTTTKKSTMDRRAEKARLQLEQDLELRGSMVPWKHGR